MGAVAVGQQLNTSRQNPSSKASRRKPQTPAPPRQFKDTTKTRYNAIRHGILARSAVMEGEDLQQYEDLRTALSRDLSVVGMVEEMWLDQLTSCYWRQQRILRAETEPDARLDLLHRYEVSLRNESIGLLAQIREAQRLRREKYFNARTNPDRTQESAQTAARHESTFWHAVQADFDGPEPSRGAAVPAAEPSPAPAARPTASPASPPPAPPPSPRPAPAQEPAAPQPAAVASSAVRFAATSPQGWSPTDGASLDAQVRAAIERGESLERFHQGA